MANVFLFLFVAETQSVRTWLSEQLATPQHRHRETTRRNPPSSSSNAKPAKSAAAQKLKQSPPNPESARRFTSVPKVCCCCSCRSQSQRRRGTTCRTPHLRSDAGAREARDGPTSPYHLTGGRAQGAT